MAVTVCIATYNVVDLTKVCFRTLLETTKGLVDEIIVVDDGSTDGTRDFLKELRAPFKVVLNDENKGYAANNNMAASMAKNDILCFLNNDTVLKGNWLEPMVEVAKLADSGMVGNVQWSPKTGRFDHMGIYFGTNLHPRHYGSGWLMHSHKKIREFRALTGACCVIRKELFQKFGGFDTTFRNGYEDVDLCLKLFEAGYKNKVVGSSIIHHYVSSSPGRHAHTDENWLKFVEKWGEMIAKTASAQESRYYAVNYFFQYLDRPWKYNWGKLKRSVQDLLGIETEDIKREKASAKANAGKLAIKPVELGKKSR